MNLFFWQPKVNFYKLFSQSPFGQSILVFSNYATWIFLLYPSYLLVKIDTNIFWQLLIATIISEIVEKKIKLIKLWPRPAFITNLNVPKGLIKSWYLTGSFPSGHTIKATFFLLLLIQHQLLFPAFFVIITTLLFFRVITGFHYPIDIVGGFIVGVFIWAIISWLQMPESLNQVIGDIFSFVFYYPLKIGI